MKKFIGIIMIAAIFMCICGTVPAMAAPAAQSTGEPIESAFKDAAFLTAVCEIVGKTNGEHIYRSDVENITTLEVQGKNITNLNGIEYFTGLEELYCYNNKIVDLDLSHNTNLVYIDCSFNMRMETLNVSCCSELSELECNYTQLQRLDVRNNPKLTRLVCYGTYLRTLNLSNNLLLEELDAYNSHLASLDVSNNTKLEYLDCTWNDMVSVENVKGIENCTLLDEEAFYFEPQNAEPVTERFTDEKFLAAVRKAINKPYGDIYVEDLVGITELDVSNIGLTSLDGIEYMQALESLNCANNKLTNLDLTNNHKLAVLHCYDNFMDLGTPGNSIEGLEIIKKSLGEPGWKDIAEVCFQYYPQNKAEHEHQWGAWDITDAPTLTATGTAERVCQNDNTHKAMVTLPVLSDSKVWTKGTVDNGLQQYTSIYGTVVIKAQKPGGGGGGGIAAKPEEPAKPAAPSEPEVAKNPFVDVRESDYYHGAVLWAVKSKITTGTSDTTFSPNEVCSRGQAVTFLWRAAGSPESVFAMNPFADVSANAYYYKAVLWAMENGIITGTSATAFSPEDHVTRGQAVTLLWRMANKPDVSADISFADVSKEDYYHQAVAWAAEQKITKGTSDTEFSPAADCTRGQIVTLLYKNSDLK